MFFPVTGIIYFFLTNGSQVRLLHSNYAAANEFLQAVWLCDTSGGCGRKIAKYSFDKIAHNLKASTGAQGGSLVPKRFCDSDVALTRNGIEVLARPRRRCFN